MNIMNNKKKIAIAGGVSVAAIAALCAGTFAFFSDTSDKVTTATAGIVDITVDQDLALSNPDNINPGDNDPFNPEGHRPGTAHDLTFGIANLGNKSIMTRNIITLSVKDQANNLLDPSVYHLLANAQMNADGTVADGQSLEDIEVVEVYYAGPDLVFSKTRPADCQYVRYITTQVALNGADGSTQRETEDGLATGQLANGATVADDGASVDYLYRLMMEHDTQDEYELSTLQIEIESQAMQYRNTSDDTWTTIFTDMLTMQP